MIEASLSEHCAAQLAGYKRPRRYVFRDSLPRNAYGKILERELRDELSGTSSERRQRSREWRRQRW